MIEGLSKFSGAFKCLSLPVMMLASWTYSVKEQRIKNPEIYREGDIPGDNFPYIVMLNGVNTKQKKV